MTEKLDKLLESTTRLEEQSVGLRRDVQALSSHTSNVLSTHTSQINSLQRSRAKAIGWGKGTGVVTVLSAIAGWFKFG